jgi:hypothetical protein
VHLGVIANRVVLVEGDTAVDLERASGRFPADPEQLFNDWDGLVEWAATAKPNGERLPRQLGSGHRRTSQPRNPRLRLPQRRPDHDIEGDRS